MKQIFWTFFLGIVMVSPSAFSASQTIPPKVEIRTAQDFTLRNGIPNFFRKTGQTGTLKVAYFGGSITEQNGWRVQSFRHLRDTFRDSEFVEIPAAIGGTGSSLGAFRLEQDVLEKKPDLVFIEFAVNDRSVPTEEIFRSMEGIVRHIWNAMPETDICFVYPVIKEDFPALENGRVTRAVSIMEMIADHYGIPSVNMGLAAARLSKAGKLQIQADQKGMKVVSGDTLNVSSDMPITPDGKIPFSPDGVHPYENTGHVIYNDLLKKALSAMTGIGTAGKHVLPSPIMANSYEQTRSLRISNPGILKKSETGTLTRLAPKHSTAKWFTRQMPEIWKLTPGAELEFSFEGTKAVLYCLRGPDVGNVEITVDRKESRTESFFDPWSSYHRISTIPLISRTESGLHTIRIKVLDTPLDKAGILNSAAEKKLALAPGKYDGHNAYIGGIFILGNLK